MQVLVLFIISCSCSQRFLSCGFVFFGFVFSSIKEDACTSLSIVLHQHDRKPDQLQGMQRSFLPGERTMGLWRVEGYTELLEIFYQGAEANVRLWIRTKLPVSNVLLQC